MILLIDNYDSFTWNLVQRFGEVDLTLDVERGLMVVRNDQITADDVAGLDGGKGPTHIVISPGPCTPNEAGASSAIIQRFAGTVPILGVCLGHQCLAASNGMTVARHVIQMHGKTSEIHHDGIGVFAGMSNPFTATRYHSLVVVEESIPGPPPRLSEAPPSEPRGASPRTPPPRYDADGWITSAWTFEDDGRGGRRKVVMGLRRVFADARKFPVEGVQFHPESFLTVEGPRLLKNFLDMAAK